MGFLSKVFGGGGGGHSTSSSSSSASTNVWGAQAPYLKGLYQNAMQANNLYAPQSAAFGNQLAQGGMGAFNQLGMLSQVGNPFVQQQIGQLGNQLGNFFSQQINPAIRSDYAGLGQLGGSRQAVAQGLAASNLGDSFAQSATNLLANSTGQAINAAGAMGNLGSQLQNIQGNAALGPYAMLAQILGNPTLLSQSQSSSYGQQYQKDTSKGIFPSLGSFFEGFN